MAVRIAVIGAGVSGLACARSLTAGGAEVTVIEKGCGVGGRAATRRMPWGNFDHGTQYFTARGRTFRYVLGDWLNQGVATAWKSGHICAGSQQAQEDTLYVGVPGMSAISRAMTGGINLMCGVEVRAVSRDPHGWRLIDCENRRIDVFDWVVISAPAPEAASLLDGIAPHMSAQMAACAYVPCWAVMARSEASDPVGADLLCPDKSALAWVARNGSKPGREPEPTWVLHASPEWSRAHLEADPDWVCRELLVEWKRLGAPAVGISSAHRWRHAMVRKPLGQACVVDAELRLGACGDWCIASRLESAFDSGVALGHAIRGTLSNSRSGSR